MTQQKTQKRPTAEFLFSAANFTEIPKSGKREFCLLGRSNVGKSSFINHVFGDSRLARVSKTPGKTTLANFFGLSDGGVWVDLPGYGHARRAKTEQVRWSRLVADYCEKRDELCGIIWLCDSRHVGLEIDKEAYDWLAERGLPVWAVLTKADKLRRREVLDNAGRFGALFPFTQGQMPYSIIGEASRIAFWKAFGPWAAGLR